jgi:RNA polymerase sigma factor (sigma-70 family)
MAKPNPMLRYIGLLTRSGSAPAAGDGDLLQRFVDRREEAAFAALLQRYRGLVMGVCRRVLRDTGDAEDAFQATFVVLARKAGSIRGERSLGGWLHRVAFHIALRAKAGSQRRQAVEKQVELMRPSALAPEADRRELRDLLDEELDRLPAKYRQPLVLHYLEGKTKDETARALGWTEGTVSGRLGRARDLLRDRLARRGLALSSMGLATALAQEMAAAAVPSAVLDITFRGATLAATGNTAAANVLSARAMILADAAVRSMAMAFRRKLAAGILLGIVVALGSVAVGTAVLSRGLSSTEAHLVLELPSQAKAVSSAVFSPDNKSIAVANLDQTVTIWEVERNRKRLTIPHPGDDAYPSSLAFSADGTILAVGGQDRLVRLFDVTSGKPRGVLTGHSSVVVELAFSPDGKTLASAAGLKRDGELILWDLAQARPRTTIAQARDVVRLAFCADGATLITLDRNRLPGLKMFDIASARELPFSLPERFNGSLTAADGKSIAVPASGNCLAMAPDGTQLAFTGPDRWVVLMNSATRELRPLFQVPPNGSVSVVLSPGARKVAYIESRDKEEFVRILDGATGAQQSTLRNPGGSLSYRFSPDGKQLISWEWGGKSVRVWDVGK